MLLLIWLALIRHRDPSYDFPEIGKWPIHVQVSHYATIACKRLERGGVAGKRPPKKPSLDEIDQARVIWWNLFSVYFM